MERLQPKLLVGKEDNKGLRIRQITKSRAAILVLCVDVTFELACRFKDAFVKQTAIPHPRVEMREHISRGPKVGKTLD